MFVSLSGVAGCLGSPSLGSREKSCENPGHSEKRGKIDESTFLGKHSRSGIGERVKCYLIVLFELFFESFFDFDFLHLSNHQNEKLVEIDRSISCDGEK